MDNNCLQMIRDAYWNGSNISDFDTLHDALFNVLDVRVSDEQLRSAFNQLPSHIIGEAIQWGFSDTEVRGAVNELIKDKEDLFRKALGL